MPFSLKTTLPVALFLGASLLGVAGCKKESESTKWKNEAAGGKPGAL
jgi:hypothetical protein